MKTWFLYCFINKWFHTILYHFKSLSPDSLRFIFNWLRPSICVIIGPDNNLLPGRRQAIIWTNAGALLIEPQGTNFSKIWIEIQTFLLN